MTWTQGHGGDWNDERAGLLTKLWGNGLSCSQIAKQIGGISRCAVIGKAHRMGLPRRTRAVTEINQKIKRAGAEPRLTAPKFSDKPLPKDRPPPARAIPRPWLTRRFGECAAPVGGEGADTLSCCTPCGVENYCQEHRAIFYTKPATKAQIAKAKRASEAKAKAQSGLRAA